MLLFVPPLLWLAMLNLPVPKWAKEGNPALLYPYLLAGAWFLIVAALFL